MTDTEIVSLLTTREIHVAWFDYAEDGDDGERLHGAQVRATMGNHSAVHKAIPDTPDARRAALVDALCVLTLNDIAKG